MEASTLSPALLGNRAARPPRPPHAALLFAYTTEALACQHLSRSGRLHLELSFPASGRSSEEEYRLAGSPGSGATQWRNQCPPCCPEPRLWQRAPKLRAPSRRSLTPGTNDPVSGAASPGTDAPRRCPCPSCHSLLSEGMKPAGSVNDVALDALDLDRMKQVSVSFPEGPEGARGWGLSQGHMGRQDQWGPGGYQKSARNQQRGRGVPMPLPEQRVPLPFWALSLTLGLPPPGLLCSLPTLGGSHSSPVCLVGRWGEAVEEGGPGCPCPSHSTPARPTSLLHHLSLLLLTWRLCSQQEILEEVVRELHKVKEEIIDESEPERKQTSQLLTRLYCWVPPPRRGSRVAPGPKLVGGRSRAVSQHTCRGSRGSGGSGGVGSGLPASLPPATGAAAGGSRLVVGGQPRGPWESSSNSGLRETSTCYLISAQPLSCSWPLAPGAVGLSGERPRSGRDPERGQEDTGEKNERRWVWRALTQAACPPCPRPDPSCCHCWGRTRVPTGPNLSRAPGSPASAPRQLRPWPHDLSCPLTGRGQRFPGGTASSRYGSWDPPGLCCRPESMPEPKAPLDLQPDCFEAVPTPFI
ncbi:hypothetical protein MC885_011549 [Smutsia gigantea]|nr:hypothetical protein MC885_011549 [Smutsia gigantea]